jgi:hypothetical protein
MLDQHSGGTSEYTGRIGPHLIRFEDPILCMKFIGACSPDQAREFLSLLDANFEKYGMAYLISDQSQGALTPSETRKVLASWPIRGRYGVAVHGFSAPLRILMQLTTASRALLKRPTIDLYMADSEADARRWIAEHRRQRRVPK